MDRNVTDETTAPESRSTDELSGRVAMMVFDARARAHLTQQQLATLAGASRADIDRLENANGGGCSIALLQQIAQALNTRLDLRLIPNRRPPRTAA